jgi:hypothetical protein
MSLPAFHEDKNLQKTVWDATFHIDDLRQRRTFNRQIDTDGVSMTVRLTVAKNGRGRHQKRLRHKQEKLQPDGGPGIVAIDPGRVNLLTAQDSQTGKTKTLTRGEYNVKGRIKKLNRKTAGWEVPLRDVNSTLSLTSMRTCCPRLTSACR